MTGAGPRAVREDAVVGPGPAGSERVWWPVPVLTAVGALATVAVAWRDLRPAVHVAEPTAANRELEQLQDFRDATYFPVQELLAGGNPYRPEVMLGSWPVGQVFKLYQPYHLALHLPFGLGSYGLGALAFSVVSLLLLVVLAVLAATRLRRWMPVPVSTGTALLSALLLFGQLGKAQLYVGQINPLIAVGVAGALIARRAHPAWASVALGVAWIKPQFGLPLALLLAARGSPRVALAGTGVAAAASLPVVALLVVREGGVGGFFDAVRANLAYAGEVGAFDASRSYRVDLSATVFRATGWAPPAAELVAMVVVLGLSAWALRGLVRRERVGGDDAPVAAVLADLLVAVAVVTAIVHQPGDLLVTFPATVAAAGLWVALGNRTRAAVSRPLLGASIALISVPYLHVHQVDDVVTTVLGAGTAGAMDGVAIVTAWVVVLILAVRVGRQPKAGTATDLAGSTTELGRR